ncbi:MAG: CDGSH iron-sulfur domain-containing protein [Trueperaceae bacterium]|nr:CDGSH iron-sulfur domain-containing protein [Trueperaceae bacterium]
MASGKDKHTQPSAQRLAQAEGRVTVEARADGPLKLSGVSRIVDEDGNELPIPAGLVALCRCGQSGTMPFCDGSHRRFGFRAAAYYFETKDTSDTSETGERSD